MLLSHAHNDHASDVRPNAASPGTCAAPATAAANPQSNFATIVAAKNAAVLVPGELSTFFARKIQNVRAAPTPACPAVTIDNRIDVPRAAPCTASIRPGGSYTVSNGGAESVRIAAVQAIHSNGIAAALIDPPGVAPGLTGYGGTEAGFVVTFTNGLTAYLTGDSGMFGDQETIIARFYKANLMVINMSDQVTFGPREAAFVTRELVRPRTVMPSHVNEAATSGGQIVAGTRVALFESLLRRDVALVLPLSNVTRAFDGEGRCVDCD
jgi:L-ascorbate metabolism protein UlaG (beta-lactamase superfamily)